VEGVDGEEGEEPGGEVKHPEDRGGGEFSFWQTGEDAKTHPEGRGGEEFSFWQTGEDAETHPEGRGGGAISEKLHHQGGAWGDRAVS